MVKPASWLGMMVLLLVACDGSSRGANGCQVTCLNNAATLMSSCPPTGTCTEQDAMTGASMSTVDCFDNGVKCSRSMASSTSMTMTVKKDSDACYSMIMGLTTSGDTTMELRNAAGATVATIVESGTTGGQTIACPGGLPGPIDASCSVQAASASGLAKLMAGVSCSQGTCSF